MIPKKFLAAIAFTFGLWSSQADVRLHALFTDNMVLQRGVSVPIWGWADDGEEVTVQFGTQTARMKTKDGKWIVRLKGLRENQRGTLTITANNGTVARFADYGAATVHRIRLTNVVVGEVWLASGQSNMEWPMAKAWSPETEIPAANNPMVRLYTIKKLRANSPTNNCIGNWEVCSPTTVTNFSAVAYYFARDLQKALGVPVGVIHSSWGGSPAEVWMSEKVLTSNPQYKRDIVDTYPAAFQTYKVALAAYQKQKADAEGEGKEFTNAPPRQVWKPTELYNGMIAPVIPFAIQGAIWYQGESNAGRAEQYRRLFVDMIKNWRHDWGEGNFPFLEVQLAPFIPQDRQPGTWPELREAQVHATKVLPKVGIAVITDVGEKDDIHPTKKEPVGARLALAARAIAYKEHIVYSGPMYKGMKVQGNKAVISFEHVGSGLVAKDGELKGFAIAGPGRKLVRRRDPIGEYEELVEAAPDQRFVQAEAHIQGDKVVVHSPAVPKPVAVRYGWGDYPEVNLWNKEGLPASPFRTDNFPMITAGKK